MRGNKQTFSHPTNFCFFDEHELEPRLLMPPPGGDNSIPTRATDSTSLQKLSLVDSELSEMGDNDRFEKKRGGGTM